MHEFSSDWPNLLRASRVFRPRRPVNLRSKRNNEAAAERTYDEFGVEHRIAVYGKPLPEDTAMQASAEQLAAALSTETRHCLAVSLQRIEHCTDQLTDQQLWHRPSESANSIANLMLHLCGNLRQWIISGVGGSPDARDRPSEFSQRDPMPKAELLKRLNDTVAEVDAVLAALSPARLLESRRIQGFDVTAMGAIFDAIPHFQGHTQEIIHITRSLLAERYRFWWTPKTAEEGAPQ